MKETQPRKHAWKRLMNRVDEMTNNSEKSKLRKLLRDYKDNFMTSPASTKYHHNFEGGLLIHTAEVVDIACKLYDLYGKDMHHSKDTVISLATLHDLSKTKTYEPSMGDAPYAYTDWGRSMEHDVWVIAEAKKYGIEMGYDKMMAMLQTHGGWSKIRNPMYSLGALLHCADMISTYMLDNRKKK